MEKAKDFMREIEYKQKEENEYNKKLFIFNGDEAQLKHFPEIFTNFIKNSKNGPNYFIILLDFYSKCRPNQPHLSREFTECLFLFSRTNK